MHWFKVGEPTVLRLKEPKYCHGLLECEHRRVATNPRREHIQAKPTRFSCAWIDNPIKLLVAVERQPLRVSLKLKAFSIVRDRCCPQVTVCYGVAHHEDFLDVFGKVRCTEFMQRVDRSSAPILSTSDIACAAANTFYHEGGQRHHRNRVPVLCRRCLHLIRPLRTEPNHGLMKCDKRVDQIREDCADVVVLSCSHGGARWASVRGVTLSSQPVRRMAGSGGESLAPA